jgi:hypothetical protein
MHTLHLSPHPAWRVTLLAAFLALVLTALVVIPAAELGSGERPSVPLPAAGSDRVAAAASTRVPEAPLSERSVFADPSVRSPLVGIAGTSNP